MANQTRSLLCKMETFKEKQHRNKLFAGESNVESMKYRGNIAEEIEIKKKKKIIKKIQ